MNYTFNISEEYHLLSPDTQNAILERLKLITFSKNECILSKGDVCKGIYFIGQGCCRTFITKGRKEITTSFRVEGEYICASYSYITQTPSEEYIQALEDTTCYFMSYKSIQMLLDKFVDFNVFVRKIYELLFFSETKLLNSIRTLSALERYDLFMKESPKILQRVPLGHLASFLGMSQETLSRMRSKV
jgi:CRP-like cAMP-binding protein